MNKMVMAIVKRDFTETVLGNLLRAGFPATFGETRGGMLRQSQNMIFIAVAEEQLQDVLMIIKNVFLKGDEPAFTPGSPAQPAPAYTGTKDNAAVIFVWDLDLIEKY